MMRKEKRETTVCSLEITLKTFNQPIKKAF
jgi:hypothetical protein